MTWNDNTESNVEFLESAHRFSQMHYLDRPYSSRAWGNPLHSLCSYQGKLKPSIAHFLVQEFTNPGDIVLDPFSGSGTIPLEAALQGRRPIGNDLQELAYILTLGKIGLPNPADAEIEVENFLKHVHSNHVSKSAIAETEAFGLNGKIAEYFHERNLKEVVNAREYIRDNLDHLTPAKALVFSAFLHILHGNRPYALSRRSHPVTPLKPKGPFEYRPIEPRLLAKISKSLAANQSQLQFTQAPIIPGRALWSTFEDIPLAGEAHSVITSPPFAESTRFYSSNWLRLWATGWTPDDFKQRKPTFLEERQKRTMDVYRTFFENAARWLVPQGRLIMHLGKTSSINMRELLTELAAPEFDVVFGFDESVEGKEKFGIRDQGATKFHQFLFLAKNA